MRTFLLICILALGTAACAPRVILDTQLISEYGLNPDALKQIQFYITEDVTLTRYENKAQKTQTAKGLLTVTEGRVIDQIFFKQGTKGKVVKQLDGKRLAVSFEPDDNRFLVFAPSDKKGQYMLVAKEWKGDRAVLEYAGAVYLSNSNAGNAAIGFKLKRSMKVEEKQRAVKGNKVG